MLYMLYVYIALFEVFLSLSMHARGDEIIQRMYTKLHNWNYILNGENKKKIKENKIRWEKNKIRERRAINQIKIWFI